VLHTNRHDEITYARLTVRLLGQQLHVLFYLVDGMLVDTGPSRLKKQLIPYFHEAAIQQVVLTHHHEDHTGMAAWLQHERGLPVYIHESGIPICLSDAKIPLYRRLFWGERKAFRPKPLPALVETEKHAFQVVHSPGHADDHVVLYNRERGWLFSGDAYLTSRPKTMIRGESVEQMIRSLRTILTLDFDTVFCCHAGVVEDGKEAMAAKLHYLEEVKGEVLRLHSKGYSAREICQMLYPHRYPITYFSGFEIAPIHIVKSVLQDAL
jgi:ribonuclease/clavin/mitogillin